MATVTLLDILQLEQVESDAFRSVHVSDGGRRAYGGQLVAQALIAAGRTVSADRQPHSLHGYFLRGGERNRTLDLRVSRDHDGNRFSARRVEVSQGRQLIFTLSASFHSASDGLDRQVSDPPDGGDPDALPPAELPGLVSFDYRVPEHSQSNGFLPTRYWARCEVPLPDDRLVHAAALGYLSDWSTGLAALHEGPWRPSPSLDHAVWFHRPFRLDDWVLVELTPHSAAGGRGWYTGAVYSRAGVLIASVTQESLYG
jgi:acyl-CoA thioesterase-2